MFLVLLGSDYYRFKYVVIMIECVRVRLDLKYGFFIRVFFFVSCWFMGYRREC